LTVKNHSNFANINFVEKLPLDASDKKWFDPEYNKQFVKKYF